MKTFEKETNQWIVEINNENINDYIQKNISAPQQHLSNSYTTETLGGANLTIGDMINNAKSVKIYGGSPTRLTIKDNSEATLYIIDLDKVNSREDA